MKHRFLYMLITFVFAAFCSAVSVTDAAVSRIERGVLRLHILANSDSESDQARKLLVRDALLARGSEWTADADSCADAAEIMQKKLPVIEQIARETLRAAGCDAPVKAAVCMDDFPPRTYESYTLPAGRYQTLRIEIGEGAEKNWWCIMYPNLCIPAAVQTENAPDQAEIMQSHFDAEVCDITAHPEHYAVRFKCVELWKRAKKWAAEKWELLRRKAAPAEKTEDSKDLFC